MKKDYPVTSRNDPRITSWFSLEKYVRLTPGSGYYCWAMQVAVRESTWKVANQALDEQVGAEVRRMSKLDNAVRMLTETPLIDWKVLQRYDLIESDFRALVRLIDETESAHPAINAKLTIGETAELVRQARWLAANEPGRCDTEDGSGTYDPEYLPINDFLLPEETLLYMRRRPTDKSLSQQFSHLLPELPSIGNPNTINLGKLKEYRVLECMDLYIWALDLGIDPRDHRKVKPAAIASLLFANAGEGWKVSKDTEQLVFELFDGTSRMSRELLALAAEERHDHTSKVDHRVRRGRRRRTSKISR